MKIQAETLQTVRFNGKYIEPGTILEIEQTLFNEWEKRGLARESICVGKPKEPLLRQVTDSETQNNNPASGKAVKPRGSKKSAENR
jgi:hypothetical protein